ncbi:MAG TPA: hypothetical protein DEB06_10585, partial [Phycisphaerales bacterium]|nr:hypothetical protein [Phycisphaerales bacterium]
MSAPIPEPGRVAPVLMRTNWHITIGTYGARLHGDARPTVDRRHNRRNEPYIGANPARAQAERRRMRSEVVMLCLEQRGRIEAAMRAVCERGGWGLHAVAAAPDHVHVVVQATEAARGDRVRQWMKRWLSEELWRKWPVASGGPEQWWAEGGSVKPVLSERYLDEVTRSVREQSVAAGVGTGAARPGSVRQG